MPYNVKLYIPILLLVICIALWSFIRLDQAESLLARTQRDLTDSMHLVDRINFLRDSPKAIAAKEISTPQVAEMIAEATVTAGISEANIERVWPADPRRIDDTSYKAVSTRVMLREITMHEALNFLNTIKSNGSDILVTELRFGASRGSASESERWDVDATLTYLIHSPSERI